jgi:UDP-3-O-[3-hydroxymyristoyl] glucosamine N-acyltransferase
MKLNEIAARLDCALKGDGGLEIHRVTGIDEAGEGDLTFVSNPKYAGKVRTTKASAVILSTDFPEPAVATLRSPNPYLTFARAVELFYQAPKPGRGIDTAARIAASAKIGGDASIAP